MTPEKRLQVFVAVASVLSAAVAIFAYVQSRTKNRLQEDIAQLDKQIKQLELVEKMNKHTGSTL